LAEDAAFDCGSSGEDSLSVRSKKRSSSERQFEAGELASWFQPAGPDSGRPRKSRFGHEGKRQREVEFARRGCWLTKDADPVSVDVDEADDADEADEALEQNEAGSLMNMSTKRLAV
jgi:hypothetical protein